MPQSRRGFLALALAASWERALHAAAQQTPPAVPSFRFFTAPELATVRRFAAVIVPADDRSGGAAAARVEEYTDFVLTHAEPALQTAWRRGLAQWSAEPAAELLLSRLSTANDRFFYLFRDAVTEAFYTSEEGILKELGYQGLAHLREFPGCTHESHPIPANYKPALR